ncbi:hypothetical protein V7128_17740 [Neobacillus vireti]|uniref:magnesium chelatase subunit ChlI family protein n=1 Tax=Neobacillus vireti TaxID=220686 RepID=UPI002FFD58E8
MSKIRLFGTCGASSNRKERRSLCTGNLDQTIKTQVSSIDIRKRVEDARQRQYQRYHSEITNAKVPFEIITETSSLTTEQQRMLTNVAAKQNWSNRVQIKIIRLARTIADLAGDEKISDIALWEAVTLRRRGSSKTKSYCEGDMKERGDG